MPDPMQGQTFDSRLQAFDSSGEGGAEELNFPAEFEQQVDGPETSRILVEFDGSPTHEGWEAEAGLIEQQCVRPHSADPSPAVLRIPHLLCAASCAALRRAVELEQRSVARDSVDGRPEHQINLSVAELRAFIGIDEVNGILALPGRLRAMQGLPELALSSGFYRVQCFVRRYTRGTRPFIPFHCDEAAVTINIACGDDAAHVGGRLVCVIDGAVQHISRSAGDATVHSSSLPHAVTAMRNGVRYSLIIFFHERDSTENVTVEEPRPASVVCPVPSR